MTKLTFAIDDKLWKEFLEHVIRKYGSSSKARIEVEIAIREYLERRQMLNTHS
jgi:metal-responsive CopG/Arc/MetJ family transcriptional regulator